MILTLAALTSMAPVGTWFVKSNAPAPGLGTRSAPYSRIDYALAQPSTVDGDLILVAPGDYVDEAIDFLGKQVEIESTGGASRTFISGLGVGSPNPHPLVQAVQGEDGFSVLRGFTLRNGSGRPGGDGGALYCVGSSPRIEQCRFEDNLGGARGSAVYAQGGGPSFQNCWFGGNGGNGPIFADSSYFQFYACSFVASLGSPNGNVKFVGGGIAAVDCSFEGSMGGGGAVTSAMFLNASGSQVYLSRCLMNSSVGAGVSGRGLYLEGCNTNISDVDFSNLHPADVPGGGLLAIGGQLQLTDSTFTGCETELGVGGAIAVVGCTASIRHCEFQGNSAALLEKSGGAIYKWGPENLQVSDCYFSGNRAGEGGALHVAYGPAALSNCYFLDNQALTDTTTTHPARGGAVSSLGPLAIDQCTFVGNASTGGVVGSSARESLGGAVYLEAPSTLQDCLFYENNVYGHILALGGAIYGESTAVGTQVQRVQVRRNRCVTQPGGRAQGGGFAGPLQVSNGSFVLNEAADGGGSILDGSVDQSIVFAGVPDDFAGATQATYSLCTLGHPGVGNLTGDPLFWSMDDLYLLPGSPCIDRGDPTAALDADGTRADMGALTFDPLHCGPDCLGVISTEPCMSNPNSSGQAGLTRAIGSRFVQDNLVILYSENLPVGMPGYYLTAPEPAFAPLFAGSEGNLCLGLGVIRMNRIILFANAAGQVSRTVDLTMTPVGVTVLAGDTWYYQLWFRDFSGGQTTSNTTSSARVDFL